MRSFLLCMVTGLLASVLTLVCLNNRLPWDGEVQAQSGPRFSGAADSSGPVDRLVPPGTFNADGLTADEAVNVAVYEATNRSVVNISTRTIRSDRFFLLAVPEQGSGSGAVLDQQGHVLTNYHVVEGAQQIMATLFNEESYEAELVGADPVNDLAVLRIDAPREALSPVQLGSSDNLQVGMRVFALGNPFGLDRTMSVGTIASLNRSLEVRENWVIKSIIQIDASINPGNSGGPLLDSHGRLIGINTAIATADSRQSAGIGFAIPINLVRRVVPELIEFGRVVRGDIGITHVTVIDRGLRIARIVENGPAARAGLRGPKVTRRGLVVVEDRSAADIIVALDGEPVSDASEFLGHIENKKPGDVVQVSVLRRDQVVEIPVTLGGENTSAGRRN